MGTTVSGRDIPIERVECSVGLYLNTLPLIVNWNPGSTIRSQLQTIHGEIIDLNTYSYASLAKLQKDGRRLFHSLVVFENYPEIEQSSGAMQLRFRYYRGRNSIIL